MPLQIAAKAKCKSGIWLNKSKLISLANIIKGYMDNSMLCLSPQKTSNVWCPHNPLKTHKKCD